MPAVPLEEHQSGDATPVRAERGVQGEPGAERVADQIEGSVPRRLDQQRPAGVEVGPTSPEPP